MSFLWSIRVENKENCCTFVKITQRVLLNQPQYDDFLFKVQCLLTLQLNKVPLEKNKKVKSILYLRLP